MAALTSTVTTHTGFFTPNGKSLSTYFRPIWLQALNGDYMVTVRLRNKMFDFFCLFLYRTDLAWAGGNLAELA